MNKLLLKTLPFTVLIISTPVLSQQINWSIESGLGYESNVFHTPDNNYSDTALPSTRPLGLAITPEKKDGLFIPVDVQIDMTNKIGQKSNFVGGIGFDTKFMLDSAINDASQTDVDLNLGAEYLFSKKFKNKKRKKLGKAYMGFFVSTHSQVYVDRDTGLPKTDSLGGSLSDKYSYQGVGLKGDYKRKSGKMKYMAGFVIENLNYDAPASGAEYDHKLNEIKLGVAREFSKSTNLKLKYTHSVRDYSNRYARDAATGTYSSVNNELLKYTYDVIGITLGQSINKDLKLYFGLDNSVRTDAFEAYNDNSRIAYSVRARYKHSDKTKMRAKLQSSTTTYDNAYNFDDVSRGSKENSGFDLDVKVEHTWHPHKIYYLELNHTDRTSTDDRYDYTNDVIMLGAKWEY